MILRNNKIIIHKTRRPAENNVNAELQWFCDSIGIFGDRDRDKSCFRMFIVFLRKAHNSDGLTSDQLSEEVGLSRGTIVHHLHKLIGSGLVITREGKYMLRVDNLKSLIDEIESDLFKTMDELRKTADDIDERLSL